MGRWRTVRVQIKGTILLVIPAYRVNKTKANKDANAVYAPWWKAMAMNSAKKANPRERTLRDLRKFVMAEIENKREVIILIDANEGIESRTEK